MASRPRESLESLEKRVRILLGNRRAGDAARAIDTWREPGEALEFPLALLWLQALLAAGRGERAREALAEILRRGVDLHERYRVARVLQEGGEEEAALGQLEQVLREDGDYADVSSRVRVLRGEASEEDALAILDPLSITRKLEQRFGSLSVIGRGGMGLVFRARDPRRGREVAIKVLSPMIGDDPQAMRRFLREASLLSQFEHPNVVKVFEASEEPFPHYSMELVKGDSLGKRLRQEGALPVPEVLRLAEGVLAGLVCVHQRGVLHRDIKPENILLDSAGVPRLTDFGLAAADFDSRITVMGQVMGTLGYMPPEQLRGEPSDARGDLFSLGAVLFECLSGRPAFRGRRSSGGVGFERDAAGRLSEVLRRPAPQGLVALIELLMEERPEDRVPSAAQALGMVRALRWKTMGKGPVQEVRELLQVRTRMVSLLSGTFSRVATLPGELQEGWFDEPANLRELRLLIWGLSESLARIRRLVEGRRADLPAWLGEAEELLGDLAAFLGDPATAAVDGFALRLRRLDRRLAQELAAYRISFLGGVLGPLAESFAGRVDLGIPEEEPPILGCLDPRAVERELREALGRTLRAAEGRAGAVVVRTSVRPAAERWELALEGPGIEAARGEGGRLLGPFGAELGAAETGAVRWVLPLVLADAATRERGRRSSPGT